MSFSSNRKAVHEEALPLLHRASHARSCALHVANKVGTSREAVIALVLARTNVNLHEPKSGADLLLALECLESLRTTEFH
jgi:hypothetical protein